MAHNFRVTLFEHSLFIVHICNEIVGITGLTLNYALLNFMLIRNILSN